MQEGEECEERLPNLIESEARNLISDLLATAVPEQLRRLSGHLKWSAASRYCNILQSKDTNKDSEEHRHEPEAAETRASCGRALSCGGLWHPRV